jgi:hypothetical protein
VIAQEIDDSLLHFSGYGRGIVVYKLDPKTLKLNRIWTPQ